VVLFYSTFFFFFFLAELLDTWLWRWVAFLIVFGIMVLTTAVLALFGYLKVRRIRGPQKTIESVKETREALTPGRDKAKALTSSPNGEGPGAQTYPSGWYWPLPTRPWCASTVRGVISRCTPTGFVSTSWKRIGGTTALGPTLTPKRLQSPIARWSSCCTASDRSGGPGATSCAA